MKHIEIHDYFNTVLVFTVFLQRRSRNKKRSDDSVCG